MTEQEQLEKCEKCEWKIFNKNQIPETGHCYMFYSLVYNCKQFRPLEGNE